MTDNIFQTLHELAGQDEILIRSLTDTERNPENFKYWCALADALVKRNMYELAIRCFGKAISLDTRSRQAWYIKGNPLRINQPIRHYEDQVLECYDKFIEIDPNFIDAWFNKGNLLGNLGKYDQAIECYNKAIEIDPNFIDAWISKAMTLSSSRNYKEAIICANEGLHMNSNNVYLQNIKCIALARSGNNKKSIACYNKTIEIDRNFIDAWFNKGNLLGNLRKNMIKL